MPRKKVQLCINADDFGFTPEISKGILLLMEKGLVSSTSTMAVHCGKEEIENLSKQKNISIGLHFSLTSGCNYFIKNIKNQYALARKYFSGKIKREDIFRELSHQYESIKEKFSGEITHLDAHQHIHILPAVAKAMTEFSIEKKIPYVRISKEISPNFSLKKMLFNSSAGKTNHQIPIFGLNIMGINFTRKNILRHFEFLKMKNANKAIWIVHPGYRSQSKIFNDSYNAERENELNTFHEIRDEILEFADIVPLTGLL